ncbi:hypothetical protein Droror1_Dr00008723 [Drosera rotundifolia]
MVVDIVPCSTMDDLPDDDVISSVLSYLPTEIEELSLKNVSFYKCTLSIVSRWLKTLELVSIDADDIHIDVDRLHSLYSDNICGFERVFINSPCLHDFTVINGIPYRGPLTPKEILQSCSSIMLVRINGAMSFPRLIKAIHYGFESIRVLSTELDLTRSQDATLLSEILRICHNLKELHINSKGYKGENESINYLPYPKAEFCAKKKELLVYRNAYCSPEAKNATTENISLKKTSAKVSIAIDATSADYGILEDDFWCSLATMRFDID